MTMAGGGNANRLDTFVAAQPPAFGDIRKKCAMVCEVSLVGLIDAKLSQLTTNRRLLVPRLIIQRIDLLELLFEPVETIYSIYICRQTRCIPTFHLAKG